MTTDSSSQRCCDEYDSFRRSQAARYSRRNFLQTTVGAMAIAPLAPHLMLHRALAQDVPVTANTSEPILVVIQLAGGNDGLNTMVPFADDSYYRDRPTINVPRDKVIQLNAEVGLNPNLQGLKPLYDGGKVAVVQDVGYPNPDRSHFRSTQIWESGDPVGMTETGWLGRYLDIALANDQNPLKAVAIGPLVPLTLASAHTPVASIESVNTFRFMLNRQASTPIMDAYRTMYGGSLDHLPTYLGLVRRVEANADLSVKELQAVSTKVTAHTATSYPTSPLARELQLVSQIIAGGLGTRIFHVTLGGFDDHSAEVYTHATLMKDLGDSLAAFYADLTAQGKADQVVTMTFSEFGRRVKENAGRGTDHGTAAPLFVVGGKVKGGVYGAEASLENLDDNGDLKYQIDFRSVYGTIIDDWLGADHREILGGTFERLPFL